MISTCVCGNIARTCRVYVDIGVGQLQALPDPLEVVAALRFLRQREDHGGLEFSLRFEAAELHVGSSCATFRGSCRGVSLGLEVT